MLLVGLSHCLNVKTKYSIVLGDVHKNKSKPKKVRRQNWIPASLRTKYSIVLGDVHENKSKPNKVRRHNWIPASLQFLLHQTQYNSCIEVLTSSASRASCSHLFEGTSLYIFIIITIQKWGYNYIYSENGVVSPIQKWVPCCLLWWSWCMSSL